MSTYPGLLSVTVTLTPPGGVPVVVSSATAAEAAAGSVLSQVGEIVLSTSRPTPRDHAEPGVVEATVRLATPDAVPRGTQVLVQLHLDAAAQALANGRTSLSFASWVDQVKYRRTPAGIWEHSLVCGDVVAAAAGVILASSPWPGHTQAERLAAITAAAGVDLIAPVWSTAYAEDSRVVMKVRDVDNANALDVIQRTGAWFPDIPRADKSANRRARTVRPSYNGLVAPPPPGSRLALLTDEENPRVDLIESETLVRVPASGLTDMARARDRSTMLNAVTVNYAAADSSDTSKLWRGWSAGVAGTSQHTLNTDVRFDSVDLADAADWAAEIMQRNEKDSVAYVDATTIDLAQADYPARLLDYFGSHWWEVDPILIITDAPTDAPDVHMFTAATLTIRPLRPGIAPTVTLEANICPARLGGIWPTRVLDWHKYTGITPTFRHLANAFYKLTPSNSRFTYLPGGY